MELTVTLLCEKAQLASRMGLPYAAHTAVSRADSLVESAVATRGGLDPRLRAHVIHTVSVWL